MSVGRSLSHEGVSERMCGIEPPEALKAVPSSMNSSGMEPAALESQDEYSLMTVAPTWLWRIKKSTLRAVFSLNPRLQNEFINGLLDNRDTLEEFVLNPEEEAALRGSGYGKAASSDDEPEVVRRGASRAAIEFGSGAIYGH